MFPRAAHLWSTRIPRGEQKGSYAYQQVQVQNFCKIAFARMQEATTLTEVEGIFRLDSTSSILGLEL